MKCILIEQIQFCTRDLTKEDQNVFFTENQGFDKRPSMHTILISGVYIYKIMG